MNHKATILYIEDDDGSRTLIDRVLSYAGYKVLTASRALEGIDLAIRYQPDLILTDINLPDLNGREITTRLRADSRLRQVPIVALTAQSQQDDREKAYVAGVNGYIVKPINVNSITEQIEQYLAGKQDPVDHDALRKAQAAYSQDLVQRLETNVRELEDNYQHLQRIERIKDDFIQLTAHELRTPLTTVYGYCHLVRTSTAIQAVMAQQPEVEITLNGLIDSIERLNTVVNEIITISRIASGRVDLKPAIINLGTVMQSVVDDYHNVIEQRGITLHFDPTEWPARAYVDRALLELAFSNVVGNAIKYTPDNGQIEIHSHIEAGNRLRLSIKDSGIGIDPQDHERIFDRFYTAGDTQLHSTSKTAFRGGGLGLGLAICRGIVNAHHGRIWVESPGCDETTMPGSTFYIELSDSVLPPT